MTALLKVVGDHFPAVERDLIVGGLHFYDIGTAKISWAEFESFVMAAPPTTAIHTSRTDAWNAEAQRMAALKPPVGGIGATRQVTETGRPMSARDGRARNLRDLRLAQQGAGGGQEVHTKKLMPNATPLPLDKWKERYAQLHPKTEKSA